MRQVCLLAAALMAGVLSGCGAAGKMPEKQEGQEVVQMAVQFSSFQEFLDLVKSAASPEAKQDLVRQFEAWAASRRFPLVEETRAHFVYVGGRARGVTVPGDFNSWDVNADGMTHLEGTDLWYLTKAFPPTARLDYKFHVNGRWVMDPRNPRTMLGGFGPNSELRMSGYEPPPEIEFRPGIPHGMIEDFDHENPISGEIRRIQVYLPPGYTDSQKRYPVLYVQDGAEYITLAQINHVADFLLHEDKVRDVVIVCIPPLDRGEEYAVNEAYEDYVVNEVVPTIDARYRTVPEPRARAIMGASLGGVISAFIAYRHPDMFGNCAGQSTYFAAKNERMVRLLEEGPMKQIRWYLDVGTFEVGVSGSDLLDQNRRVRSLLERKGYDVFYREYPEGHSWGSWKAHVDDILLFFWPNEEKGAKK